MSVPMKPGDPAYWMLFDDFTTTPVVYREDCYICRDEEFAQMGLPLCRPCPRCQRSQQDCQACGGTGGQPDHTPCTDCLGTGKLGLPGHIPADDSACTVCEYEDGPGDYPQPVLVPPYTAKAEATTTAPGEPYSPASDLVDIPGQPWREGEGAVITVPVDCTVQGVMIWDSSNPPVSAYWVHVGKALRAGEQVHVEGSLDVTAS